MEDWIPPDEEKKSSSGIFGIGESENKVEPQWIPPQEEGEAAPTEESSNPAVGLARGLAKGTVYGIPKLVAQASQFAGIGGEAPGDVAARVAKWGNKGLETNKTPGMFEQAGEMIPESVGIPMGLMGAGKALQLVPNSYAKAAGGILWGAGKASQYIVPAVFGLSQAQQTKETAKERGVDPGITPYVTGAIEWAGETLGNIALGKLFGPLSSFGENFAKQSIKQTLMGTVGGFLKKLILETMPIEISTEMGQNYFEALAEKRAGIRPEADPWAEAISAIGPTAIMTLLVGGGGGTLQHFVAAKQAEVLALPVDQNAENKDKLLQQRMNIAGGIADIIPKENQALKDQWIKYAEDKIKSNQPIDTNLALDTLGMEIDTQLTALDTEDSLGLPADKQLTFPDAPTEKVGEKVAFNPDELQDKDKYSMNALGDLEVKYAGQPEETIIRDEIRRRSEGAGGTQLKTVTRKKELSYQEESALRRKYGKNFKWPMETVKLTLTEANAHEQKQAELRVVAEQEAKAKKELADKEYAEENTKIRKHLDALPEESALRQVLERIHEHGLKVDTVTEKTSRYRNGRHTLVESTRQKLHGHDYTTTDAIRKTLTRFGFPQDKGANKKGTLKLDELADELNNAGTEAPPHIPGEQYTGVWDAKGLVYMLTHATPETVSKTSAQTEVSFLEEKYLNEETAKKARIAELEAIPDDERSAAQHEELFDLNGPVEDVSFNQEELDAFEPGDVPFKSSPLYGKANARLKHVRDWLDYLQKGLNENPSPELKARLEERIKDYKNEEATLLGKIKTLTRGEEERSPAKKSGDDNAIDFLARMDETSDHLTADQVISIFEQYTGGKFVYRWLAPLLNKYKVVINFDWEGEKLNDVDFGQYDKNLITFGSIEAFKKSDKGAHRQFAATFAHEAIHAIIDNALKGNSQASYRLKSRLDILRKELIEYHKEHGGSDRISSIINLRIGELAAYGFTDEELAHWMNGIAGKGKGEAGTLWDKFKKIILDFIGAEAKVEATKLDELAKILDDVVGIAGASKAIMGTQTSLAFKDTAIKATKGTPSGVVIYRSGDTYSSEVWEWGDDVTYFGGGEDVAKQYGKDVKEYSLPKDTKLVSVLIDEDYGEEQARSEGVIVCDGVSVYLPNGTVYSTEVAFKEFLKAGNQGIVEFPSLKELRNGFYENANFILKNSLVKEMNMPIPANANQMELPFKHSAFHGGRDVRKSKEGKLSLKHAGTGTGGTAQGHGLYFADLKQVSEYYRDLVTRKSGQRQDVYDTVSELIESIVDSVRFEDMDTEAPNKSLDEYIAARSKNVLALMTRSEELPAELNTEKVLDEVKLIAKVSYYDSKAEAYRVTMSEIKEAQRSIEKLVSLAQSYITKRDKGVLYKVELAPKPDEYLLWDEPLSRQSEKIKKALEQSEYKDYIIGRGEPDALGNWGKESIPSSRYEDKLSDTGATIYRTLAAAIGYENFRKSNGAIRNEPDEKAASEHLHSLGIRGNKYLDAHSRGINTAGPTIVAYYESGEGKVTVGYGKTIEEARENTDSNWFKQKIVEIKFETQEAPKPTYNYVIFSEDDVEITEIFTSIKNRDGKPVDKRELAVGIYEGKLNQEEVEYYEAQMATRLMSLGKKDDFVPTTDKKTTLFRQTLKKIGALYERTIGTDRDRGFYNLPQVRERHERAVETQKSAIHGAGAQQFNLKLVEAIAKERLTRETIEGLLFENKALSARKKELLTAMRRLQRQGKEAVDYATAAEVTKINVRLKEIPKTIDKLKASIKPTIEIDPKGYKGEKFAEANELARQNGYELIPIKERTGCYNAFINRTTKQIFSEVGGLTSVFNLIGHELSHVGVKGHASNKETQMFIDTTTAAFVQYKGELGRLLGRKVSEAFALEEYAADLQGGIKENFGVTLADGLHTGAKVDVIAKTAEYEEIEVQEGTQKVGVTSKDVNVLEEALSGEIKIGLKNGLISMKENMKPFLKNAPQAVKDIYNGLNDFREFAYTALTNPAFAGWLHSVVDYSSRWKGEKASFRVITNPSTGKEEPVRRETVWNSLERKMIAQIGTRTYARTKLDALTDLLNKELPNAFTASTGEEEMAEAALKYKTADDFINDVSYVPTNKTKNITFGPAKTEVQVRIFENKKGQQWQEPVIFKNANANTVGTATYDDFKAIYRDLYKKGWHNPSMYLRNSGLRRIWETAHGIPQQQKREAINKAYTEQVEKNKQTPSRSVMPKAEGGVPLTRKELTISKAAAGFSVSTRKMTAEEKQEEQRAYVEDFGIASLPRELQRGAKALINIEFGSSKYGSRDTVNNALWAAIVKIYEGNANAGKLAQETFDEVQIAVKEELELIDKPLNIKPTEEADINAWIETEGKRAAQKMAINYQKQMAKQGWSYGNPQEVTEPIVRKEATFKAPATLESNEKILRKMSASGKTSEVGSIIVDVFEDYIQLTKMNLTRKANASGAIASLFKENKGAETIRLDVDTSTARADQERFVELARILTAFGAKLIFKPEGGSEYVLSRDDFGKSIENLEDAKDEGLPTTPAQIKKQARMKMASFGELEDSFNPDEDADVTDAIFTSVKAGPVKIPTTPRELNILLKGDWLNNQSAMPAETHKNMMNVISQYGGLKWSKVRETLSLPYQNAQKSVDWARVYHFLGEVRVEARDKLVYEWMSIANKFLNRRKLFKEADYTRKQIKDAEYRIGRVITLGDENLRNDLFSLREQIKEIDNKLDEPLLHSAAELKKEKALIEDKIAQIEIDKAYSFEQVQNGIIDDDGSKVKLNQLEYDMYRSVRASEDAIFERILSHMRDTLYNQYRGQRWFKLLAASLGEDISQEDAQKIVGNLKEASDPKKISVKLKDIFKRINYEFEKVPDKEAKDVLSKYEKISKTVSNELKELRDYMANVYEITPERDLFGAKSYPQLDQAIREMFVAYQRTRPQLKKIRDLRNTWGEWPGFFPRQREKGDIKMQLYERIPNAETGAMEEKEVYSAHFSTDAEAQNVYAHIMEKFGTDGALDESRYEFKYPPVSKMEENSFDGLRDFNLQALIEKAFESMQAKGGYFDENGKPIDIKDEIWGSAFEAIANQFQKRGAAAHGIHRKQAFGEKAIKGYLEKDHAQILIDHITAMAGLLTKQDAAQNVMEVMSDLKDKTRGPELRKYIKGQLRNDTSLDRLSSKARSFAFVWYLGAMIKSATVNSTQPYIVGIPVMAAYMRSKGIKGSATVTQLNASRTIAQNGGMLFKDPSEWGDLSGIDAKQRRYLTEGVVGGSMAAQAIRFIKGQTSGWGRVWNQTFDVLATPFAMVERYNRMTSGLAMFNIAYDHYQSIKGKEESDEDVFEKAMVDANKFINDVHYPIGKHNLPIPASGGDIASVSIKTLYVFRTFNHNFLLNQFNFLRSAIRLRTKEGRNDPEVRAQATNDLKTFIHTMALVAMFGGMMGLPFLKDLFDWYEKQFGYSPKQWVRQTLRGVGGQTLETMGMGGIPAVLGGNISGSLAIGVPFMGTNPDSIFGVWGGLKEKGKRAVEAAKRGDYYRVATNVSPEFIRNPVVALTESDFGRQTLGTRGFATTPQGMPSYASSGKPLSLTGGEALWKAAGFQPTRYAKEREIEQSVKVQILWAKEQKKNISETLKIDRLQNDPNAMRTMMTSVNKLNKKIRDNKIPEPPAVMSRIIQASKATKNLQKRRELSRRNELLE